MRGDFTLYKARWWNPAEWLISHFTNGPYIHCEIDLGDGWRVGEHGVGIFVHKEDLADPVFVTPKSRIGQQGIEDGLAWVNDVILEQQQSGGKAHRYGWTDIIADILKLIGQKIALKDDGHWDCSHFVTRYLIHAQAEQPLGILAKDPATVSPNDLARAFGEGRAE